MGREKSWCSSRGKKLTWQSDFSVMGERGPESRDPDGVSGWGLGEYCTLGCGSEA